MNILKNKEYRTYSKVSRYSSFPTYYNTKDDKYMYGTTAYLKDTTAYTAYVVQEHDTYDSIALDFYNNPTYFWIICSFNHIQDPFEEPTVGLTLKIPTMSLIEFE